MAHPDLAIWHRAAVPGRSRAALRYAIRPSFWGYVLLAIASFLFVRGASFEEPLFGCAYGLTVLGLILVPKQKLPIWAMALMAFIGVSAYLSVIGARFWGQGTTIQAASAGLLLVTFGTLAWARKPTRVLEILIPFAVLHAAWVIGEGLISPSWSGERAVGWATNPNHAAGLLMVAMAYLAATRRYGLAALMGLAVLFTGSRLGLLAIVVIGGIVAMRGGARQAAVTALAVSVGAALVIWAADLSAALRLDQLASNPGWLISDLAFRAETGRELTWLPQGPSVMRVVSPSAVHVVPLIVMDEYGLLAGIAWLGLCIGAVTRAAMTPAWFALIPLLLASLVDPYVWLGALGLWPWLLIGAQLQQRSRRAAWAS